MAAPEPAAAEQEAVPGADAGRDRQVPAHGVVRRLQSQPLARVHGRTLRGGAGRALVRAPPVVSGAMTDAPWLGDTVSLVDAFRSGRALAARGARGDARRHRGERAQRLLPRRRRAGPAKRPASADVSQPFGGVPMGVKELDPVAGWPATEASLVFADRRGHVHLAPCRSASSAAGAVPVGQTTASEFGGLNVSVTKLYGVTHNPWHHGRTAGGSSGGQLGGGGRRSRHHRLGRRRRRVDPHPGRVHRPARHEGHGRAHPHGPAHGIGPDDRGARAAWRARCATRPLVRRVQRASTPATRTQPAARRGLGARPRAATTCRAGAWSIVADLGGAIVRAARSRRAVVEAAEPLTARRRADRSSTSPSTLPGLGFEWAIANLAGLAWTLGDLLARLPRRPDRRDRRSASTSPQTMLQPRGRRPGRGAAIRANEAMADVFDQVDFIIAATNPDVAFPAHDRLSTPGSTAQKVRPREQRRADVPGQRHGQPRGVDPGRHARRPAGRHADHRPPPRGRAPARPRRRGRARPRPWPLVAPGAPR